MIQVEPQHDSNARPLARPSDGDECATEETVDLVDDRM